MATTEPLTEREPLSLSVQALGDQNGNPLGAALQNGSVTVAPVPLPAAAWLLVSGMARLSGFSRKRSSR
jgi:hypothetical protein